ncbi:MAG: four helix bundle protein [Chitinophagaceae bacterium]
MPEKIFDLEVRLVEFSCRVIEVVEALPNTRAGNLRCRPINKMWISSGAIIRRGPKRESRMDFIHKMKIVLKELKETRVCLKIISKSRMIQPVERLQDFKS